MSRVLVIDDDVHIRAMLKSVFEAAEYDVDVAADGGIGLRLHRANPFHVIVTDLVMPEMEGIETIMALKDHCSPVKIVAMSGGGRIGPHAYLDIAEKVGADCCFVKPIDIHSLLKVVESFTTPIGA